MAVVVLLSGFFSTTQAVDFGVKGKLFDIHEIDIRGYFIQAAIDNVDIELLKDELTGKAKDFYSKLPNYNLPISKSFVVNYVDPTKVYEDDFWNVRRDKDGKLVWYKMFESGTEVNWLENNDSPFPVYVIFDFESASQKLFFKEVVGLVTNPYFVPVFTGGDVNLATKYFGRSVTYLNNALINEYDISYTPSLVSRGVGEQKNAYQVVRFDIEDMSPKMVAQLINGENQ
jgi:hypothetical protein